MGSLRLATAYGCPDLAVVSKGQEFAGYDPRGEKGMGLAYATSNIGATHMRGDPAYIELLGVPMLIDPLTLDGKARLVKDWQDVFALIDSVGLCVFFSVRNLVTPYPGHTSRRPFKASKCFHRCKIPCGFPGAGGRADYRPGAPFSEKGRVRSQR